MLETLHLTNTGPAPQVSVQWAPRLNIITGDNGLGKSFLLDISWWALTKTWSGHPALPHPGKQSEIRSAAVGARDELHEAAAVYNPETALWESGSRPPLPGVVVYAKVDGGFSVWDSARNHPVRSANAPAAFHFEAQEVWDGLKSDGKELCEGLERDWVSWQKGGDPQFNAFVEVLKSLSPPGEPIEPGQPRRVFINEGRDRPTLKLLDQEVPAVLASSAIKRVLALAYMIVWTWTEHRAASILLQKEPETRMVILVDEPETHLHPKWQRSVVPSLLKVPSLIMGPGCTAQMIFATHSPLVLASVEPVFDEEQDALIHLEQSGNALQVGQELWAKQGDATNWLVSPIFGLEQGRSIESEEAIEDAERYMRGEGGNYKEIDERLGRLLPDHDRFWPRWIVTGSQPVGQS